MVMEEEEARRRKRRFIVLSVLTIAIVAAVVPAVVLLNNNTDNNVVELDFQIEIPEIEEEEYSSSVERADKEVISFDLPTDQYLPSNSNNASDSRTGPQIATTVNSYTVLETISHDRNAFTQGLTFDPHNNTIVYESTGQYRHSSIRQVDIANGNVLLRKEMPDSIFGEGLAFYRDNESKQLIHITWQSRRGFIFDADTLDTRQEFTFTTTKNEGWGITYVPTMDQFIVTDGSNNLHFWNHSTLQEVNRIPVMLQLSQTDTPQPVYNLNEIEWDNATGTLLSNVWKTNYIVRIDPTTGRVVTRYDLSQLKTTGDVLNGIAIVGKDLWVTGKWWPQMYKIEFISPT